MLVHIAPVHIFSTLKISSTKHAVINNIPIVIHPLKNEILKITATVSSIALLAGTDIRILCLARTAIAFLTILYSTVAARKFIGYQFRDLVSDIYKPFVLSLFMSCMIYPLSQTGLPVFLILVMQTVLGICIYAGGMLIWMKSDADDIVRYIKSHMN